MTTFLMLLLGLGTVLIISAFESNPDGSDVSIIQTVKDVWSGNVSQGGKTGLQSGPAQVQPGTGGLGGGTGANRTVGETGIGEGELVIHELNARIRQSGQEPVDPRVLRYMQQAQQRMYRG